MAKTESSKRPVGQVPLKQRESTLGCRTVQAQCCQGDE